MQTMPGQCAILGSGETTAVGRRVLSQMLPRLEEPRTIAVLDTPAGFQPNRVLVAEKIVQFLRERLGEFRPQPQRIETRQEEQESETGTAILAAITRARAILAGPGSPTYMIRELQGTTYFDAIRQAHANGSALYVSSAASIAMSSYSLPVYEIFKVGDEPSWYQGLDFFKPFGMNLAIVPHWNNNEGGADLDTSFCYMGRERFSKMLKQLPEDVVVFGIDEHTACILDFATSEVAVEGKGSVHIIREGQMVEFQAGESFPLTILVAQAVAQGQQQALSTVGNPIDVEVLLAPGETLDPRIEEQNLAGALPAPLIDALVTIRADLRAAKQWPFADRLRDTLSTYGIVIEDTPQGSQWHIEEEE